MKTAVMAIMLLGIGELLVGQKPFDTPNLPPTRMRATIENGYSLRDDGRGAYVDDSDFAVVRSNQSFAIAAWKFIDWLSNKPDPTAGAERFGRLLSIWAVLLLHPVRSNSVSWQTIWRASTFFGDMITQTIRTCENSFTDSKRLDPLVQQKKVAGWKCGFG
jgi:hypothetical protein